MCGSATLAIVLSTPCMIVASMIEIVIAARLAPAPRSPPPLTRQILPFAAARATFLSRRECRFAPNRYGGAGCGHALLATVRQERRRSKPNLRSDHDAVAGIGVDGDVRRQDVALQLQHEREVVADREALGQAETPA